MAGTNSAPGASRTVVIGVNWLGDTIMSLPALCTLRKWLSEEEIHVVCPSSLVELVRMAQVTDHVWGWPQGTRRRIRLLKHLRAQRAILFPNSFRSAWIAFWAGVPKRWGYAGQWRHLLLDPSVPASRRPKAVHHSEIYMELLKAMGWKGEKAAVHLRIPPEAQEWALGRVGKSTSGRFLIGICPGAAYGPAKRWPPERFVAVARGLMRSHRAKVILLGNSLERDVAAGMADELGQDVLNLAGLTDLPKLAALMSRCDLILSNDSGPMHLAAVLGVPVVAVFGSTDPSATAPMGPHRIASAGLPCSPCFRRLCPEGHNRCLLDIRVEDVLEAAQELLEFRDGCP